MAARLRTELLNKVRASSGLSGLDPFRGALTGRRRVLGDEHPDTLTAMHWVGTVLKDQDETEEALLFYRQAFNGRRRVFGLRHPHTLASAQWVGWLLMTQEKYGEAEPFYRHAVEARRALDGEDAETLVRECYDRRKRALDEDHWHIYNTLSLLGESIAGQKRFGEAEPILIEAYNKLDPPDGSSHYKSAALERIVACYREWHQMEPEAGHDAKAGQWEAPTSH